MKTYTYYKFVIDLLCDILNISSGVRMSYFKNEEIITGVGGYIISEDKRNEFYERVMSDLFLENRNNSKYLDYELIMFTFIVLYKSNI